MNNRIDRMSVVETTTRQTPETSFGATLARSVQSGVQVGSQLLGGVVGSSPVLSAAVSGVKNMVAAVSGLGPVSGGGSVAGASGTAGAPGVGGAGEASGGGGAWDLLAAQKAMQDQSQSFNAAYLHLQDSLQKESREFNAISNIMKVRHDTAKAAINNIR